MSKAWAKGSTSAWRRTRAIVLERDKHQCQLRLPGTWTTSKGHIRRCLSRATHVHHLDGKAYGDDPARLIATCAPCNLKTGNPTKTPDPEPKPRTRW